MKKIANLGNLKPHERRALTALVDVLRKRFRSIIHHVMLFGSKARGDSDPESDIDLLIVVDEYSWALEKEIGRFATETDYEYKVVLSDHIVSNIRFEEMAARREPFYCNLEREGIDLWTPGPQLIT
jgi:uncharacterized protein